jgi:hypothetical protein
MRTLLFCVIACTLQAAYPIFYAPFNKSTDATIAKGDKRLHSAPNYKSPGQPTLEGTNVTHAGDHLRFTKKNTQAIYFHAANNTAFDPKNWSGTISFWLSLDPETDLDPGYCDPIQITDTAFDDSAIWVDFTKDDKPRHFRLGVFGAKSTWNPTNIPADKNPQFLSRLIVEKNTPFAKGKWTHIAITHQSLGSGKGTATLYLNGKPIGTATNITEPFAWDPAKATIRLGVNYTGLFDELAIYDQPLNAKQVGQLYKKGR